MIVESQINGYFRGMPGIYDVMVCHVSDSGFEWQGAGQILFLDFSGDYEGATS